MIFSYIYNSLPDHFDFPTFIFHQICPLSPSACWNAQPWHSTSVFKRRFWLSCHLQPSDFAALLAVGARGQINWNVMKLKRCWRCCRSWVGGYCVWVFWGWNLLVFHLRRWWRPEWPSSRQSYFRNCGWIGGRCLWSGSRDGYFAQLWLCFALNEVWIWSHFLFRGPNLSPL